MKAILLVSHGSHSPKTKQEVAALVEKLKARSGTAIVEYAFLEIEKPSIPDGIDVCIKKGAQEILLLLNFLNSGKHVDEDIPRIMREAKVKYPQIQISMTKPMTQYPAVIDLFEKMIHGSNR